MTNEMKYYAARAGLGQMSRREFAGRAAALGFSATAASSMFGSAVLAAGPKKGGTLRIGLGGGETTNSLDPALAASQVPFMYLSTMGNMITSVSPEGELVPALAESWEASPDVKTWTFKIRSGVEFHNGRTLTATDVMKTVQRHANEESQSGAFALLRGIADMRVDGDDLIVELDSPNSDLPFLLSSFNLIVQPDGGMEDATAGVFTGPYKLKSFEPGVRIVMERFENHWDTTFGHFDDVEIIVLNDTTARTSALQSGQVHMINQISPRTAGFVDRAANITVSSVPSRGYYCFNMFCDTAPYDNNDLRLALKYAIDREEMVEKVLAGYGSVGNDSPINGAYPHYEPIAQRSYDPDKARHHFQKSGHSGDIVIRVSDAAFPGASDAAALFQQTAKAAGIGLEIINSPADGYWGEVWNQKPFSAAYWLGTPTQDQTFTLTYKSASSWNDTRYRNPKFDKLVEEAAGIVDQEKRRELYHAASLLIHNEGGLINPMFNNFVDGYRSDLVAGWEDHPSGEMMRSFAAIKCWQL